MRQRGAHKHHFSAGRRSCHRGWEGCAQALQLRVGISSSILDVQRARCLSKSLTISSVLSQSQGLYLTISLATLKKGMRSLLSYYC